MCYSAKASFTASIVLLAIGSFTFLKNRSKSFIILSLTPVLFGIQQFAEGMVWLNNDYSNIAKNIYLFFALTFWPIWIPLALLKAEQDHAKRKLLQFFLAVGVITGISLIPEIITSTIYFHDFSISYLDNGDKNLYLVAVKSLGYALATIGALFTSTVKKMRLFGILTAVFALGILAIKICCFGSLWCFWSAITSVLIYYVIKKNPQIP